MGSGFVHDKNPSPAEIVDINASSSGVVIRFVASRIYQTLSPNPSPNGGGAFLSCTKGQRCQPTFTPYCWHSAYRPPE